MKKNTPLFLQHLRLLAIVVLTAALTACFDDGSDGSRGKKGDPGEPAPPPGVDISNATEINATITGVTIASPPVVDFSLIDDNGNAVRNLPASNISFTLAKLIPGTDGNASAWQSYINVIEQPGDGPGTEPEPQASSESGSAGTLVENEDGSYRYTFSFDINDVTDPIPVSYQPTLTHRVSFQISGFVPVDNPAFDIRPSDNAQEGIFSREIVKTANCNVCHEKLAKHGGNRFELKMCVTCHNPGSTDANSGNTVDTKVMIHKIHRGENLPSVIGGEDYCIYGRSMQCYGDVAYPQDIRNCSNCHNENDQKTPDAANWYKVPTVEACGSCHDDVNFETGENHAGGAQGNDRCTSCHTPNMTSGLGAYQKHRILTHEGADQYSFNILNIDFLGPGNEPDVTFSVTDPTNNDASYDLANDAVLMASDLRFYMAWDTTDYTNTGRSNAGAISTSVYSGGVLQANDNGDFTYTMAVGTVPAEAIGSGAVSFAGNVTAAAGTLLVKATHDFFGITDDPANPVPRRTKADLERCNGCHDRLTRHSNRNDNLNLCALCHNPEAARGSDNGPMDFKHFVHRKHAVDDIRYPQRVSNCLACHTDDGFYPVTLDSGVRSTSTTRGADSSDSTDNNRITPNSAACSVCHATAEAQLHMEQNGGNFDACTETDGTTRARVDICGPGGDKSGAIAQESCPTCHAKDRIADVAVTHSLDVD